MPSLNDSNSNYLPDEDCDFCLLIDKGKLN